MDIFLTHYSLRAYGLGFRDPSLSAPSTTTQQKQTPPGMDRTQMLDSLLQDFSKIGQEKVAESLYDGAGVGWGFFRFRETRMSLTFERPSPGNFRESKPGN